MKRKFAVFDIDGTLYRNAFFFDVVEFLVSNDKLSKNYKDDIQQARAAWKGRRFKDAYKEYSKTLVNIWSSHVHELRSSTLEEHIEDIILPRKDHVYVYSKNLLNKLKSEGYYLIAISGSFQEIVEPFAKYHGFDLVIGEETKKRNGKLIPEVEQTTYKDKHKIIEKLMNDNDLTIEDSYAIGDSINDASMLAMVTNPIAFNPEQELLEHAKRQGWKIVIERRSIAYTLEEQDGSYRLAETTI